MECVETTRETNHEKFKEMFLKNAPIFLQKIKDVLKEKIEAYDKKIASDKKIKKKQNRQIDYFLLEQTIYSKLLTYGKLLKKLVEYFIRHLVSHQERERKLSRRRKVKDAFETIQLKGLFKGGAKLTIETLYYLVYTYGMLTMFQLSSSLVDGARLFTSEDEFVTNMQFYFGTKNAEGRCAITSGFMNSAFKEYKF
jgi:hypothetical protein